MFDLKFDDARDDRRSTNDQCFDLQRGMSSEDILLTGYSCSDHIEQLRRIMSGLGRRTHYRKHLTEATLRDLPTPGENECIAKVVSTRGGNQFDIVVAGNSTPQLAILPTKFHKLVWVKRSDYVIVEKGAVGEDEEDLAEGRQEETGIRFMISHILYKDQVKHLKTERLWPEDPQFSSGEGGNDPEADDEPSPGTGDGIVYNDYDEELDDDLFVNTNRVGRLQIQESSSEEDSGDEEA